MTESSYKNGLIFIAKFYGVFYIREGNVTNRRIFFIYSVGIIVLFTVCHVASFLWKHDEIQNVSVLFMEYLNAAVLLITVNSIVSSYSFAKQTDFQVFLELMHETENVLTKIRCSCIQKSPPSSAILTTNYFVFCCLTGHSTVKSLQKHQYQKFMEILSTFILFHSTTVVLYQTQCIRYFYLEIARRFREIMAEYLTLPPEEMVEVADGNIVINGWIKSVLEKRKDEEISPIIALIISAMDKVDTASDVANRIHSFPILMVLIAVATLALDLINIVLIYSKSTEQLLENVTLTKALLFLPLAVQTLLLAHRNSTIPWLRKNIGFLAYKYTLELSNENLNLQEHKLRNTLHFLYESALWTNGQLMTAKNFVVKYFMGMILLFALIVQLNKCGNVH